MSDSRQILANLRRPRLLMQAARLGLGDVQRERDLLRLVSCGLSPEATVSSLLSTEATLETTRLSGDASYSVTRHIEVLIALLAEARLLQRDGLG